MEQIWKPLQLVNADCFVVHRFEASPCYYTIWVTDLARMWKQTLGREEIIQQALAEDSSIDPSEDKEQMSLLIDNIGKALNGEPASHVKHVDPADPVNPAAPSPKQDDTLILEISVSLPKPLAPFIWRLIMQPVSEYEMVRIFTYPLLNNGLNAMREKESLEELLAQKDAFIDRLISQMQNDGADFGKMFPGLIANKAINLKTDLKSVLERSVPGARTFSHSQWQQELGLLRQDASHDWHLKLGRGSGGTVEQNLLARDAWWKRSMGNAGPRQDHTLSIAKDDSDRKKDQESSPLATQHSRQASIKRDEEKVVSLKSANGSSTGSETETYSDSEVESDMLKLREKSPEDKRSVGFLSTPNSRNKLGRIGNRNLNQGFPPSDRHNDLDPTLDDRASKVGLNSSPLNTQSKPMTKRLGKIGGSPQKPGVDAPKQAMDRFKIPEKPPEKPPEKRRETSQERIDRRRHELSHDLQQQASNAGRRKKRKF